MTLLGQLDFPPGMYLRWEWAILGSLSYPVKAGR